MRLIPLRTPRHRTGPALALLALLSVVLFASAAAAAPGGQPATLRGWLSLIIGHPIVGDEHELAFVLLDERGASTDLAIDEALLAQLGGPAGADRRRVEVAVEGAVAGKRNVRAIRPIAETAESIAASPLEPAGAVLGQQKFVTILCRFADSVGTTPAPPSFYEGLMSTDSPGIGHYWSEISHGQIDLSGSVVVGWFNLPQPRSYYYTATPPNFSRMSTDCAGVADASVNFAEYRGINFAFNENFGDAAWGGSIFLTLDNIARAWPATWMPPGGSFQSIWAHETGHAFGMPHSASAYGTTYQNAWDVMSKDRFNCSAGSPFVDPTYGCVGQGAIAYHRDIPGWLPDASKQTVSNQGAYAIALSQLGAPPVAGKYLMAKIPIPGGSTYYTVEARRRVGYDSKLAGDAVIIHEVNPARLDDAWIVDADTTQSGKQESADAGAQWAVGETFTDATNGISVAVTGATADGFNITVTRTSGPCLDDAAPTDFEPDNAPAAANSFAVGSTVRRSFCAAGDEDWVRFEALGGWSYTIDTLNMASPTDTLLALYAADGATEISANDDGGGAPNSRLLLENAAPGAYYVRARQAAGAIAGAYDLRIAGTPPLPPASLVAAGGAGGAQSAEVATPFAAPLLVTVRDAANRPLQWVSVSFSAPGAGPGAVLSAPSALTDALGQASVTATAGQVAGSYLVTATVAGAGGPIQATFSLTNTPGAAAALVAGGAAQQAVVGAAFAAPLTVTARDVFGNPVPGVAVSFSAPAGGPTAALSAPSAVTDAAGRASVTATAGQAAGSYLVTATVAGAGGPVSTTFSLTNTAQPGHRLFLPALRR